MARVCLLYPRSGFARLSAQRHASSALDEVTSLGSLASDPSVRAFEPGYLEIGDCWGFSTLSRAGWEQLRSICPSPPVEHEEIEVDGRPGVQLHSGPTVAGALYSSQVFRAEFEPPYPMFHVEEKPSELYLRADVAARLVESTDGVLARFVDTDSALRERRARVSALRKQGDREAHAQWLPLGLVKALRAALERAWQQVRDHSDHQGVYGFGVQHTGSEYRLHVASERGLEAVVTSVMKREAGDIRPVLRREWRHALPGDALSDPLKAALDDANACWPKYLQRPGLRIVESLLRRSVALRALRQLDRRGLFGSDRDGLVLEVIDTLDVGARVDEAGLLNPPALVERFESEIVACSGVRRSRLSSIQAP